MDDQKQPKEALESRNRKKGNLIILFNPLKKRFFKKSNFQKLIQKLRYRQIRIRSAANRNPDTLIEGEHSTSVELQPLRQKKGRSARKKRKISRMLSGKMSQLINSLGISGLKKPGKKIES